MPLLSDCSIRRSTWSCWWSRSAKAQTQHTMRNLCVPWLRLCVHGSCTYVQGLDNLTLLPLCALQLLAEVILHHRLFFKLLRPWGSQAAQQQEPNGSVLQQLDKSWVDLLQMAQTTGPLLRGALEVTVNAQGRPHQQIA